MTRWGPWTLVVLAWPAWHAWEPLDRGFQTIADYRDPDDYAELVQALRDQPAGGRAYASVRTSMFEAMYGGGLPLETGQPGLVGRAAGMHDSVNFWVVHELPVDDPDALPQLQLLDVRTVVVRASSDAEIQGEVLYSGELARVVRTPVKPEPVVLLDDGGTLHGDPRALRAEVGAWMRGNGPADGVALRMVADDPWSGTYAIGPRVTELPPLRVSGPDGAPGTVSAALVQDAGFSATVDLDRAAWVSPKVSFHPFWHVWVDGQPAEPVMVTPGLLAVWVEPGVHQVTGTFKKPARWRWTWLGPVLAALGLLAWRQRALAAGRST